MLAHFNPHIGTHDLRLHLPYRTPGKLRRENSDECIGVGRRAQQAVAPLRKNRSDLVRIFFCNESVETCLHLQQRGIERPLATIVRMQLKSVP